MSASQNVRPLIGLTGRRKTLGQITGFPESLHSIEADLYISLYAQAVTNAGGIPLHLPLNVDPVEFVGRLDGILLSGGADVDPGRYNHENTSSDVELIRDEIEFTLLEAAVKASVPTLGICRGHQVLNVFAGGTLDQDEPPHARYDVAPGAEVHDLRFAPGSTLGRLYKGEAKVNSLHHQTIAKVGEGLTVTAWAEDGTIEALEMDGHDILSVQWHPEMLERSEPVFDWLIEKASVVAASRPS